jgi:hypothetical protein
MRQRTPSVFILVPGPWRDSASVVEALERHEAVSSVRGDGQLAPGEIAAEVVADDRLAEAFSWGRRGSLPDDLVHAIGRCGTAALVEVTHRLDREPGEFARLGRALWAEGGLAVRMEGSGAASEWKPWLEQLESGAPADIYDSAVLIAQDDDCTYFTCGMHQFDLPDAQIASDDPGVAIEWLDTLNIFQLAENPLLGSGHKFSPYADIPAKTLERWPDHRHHPNDGRHNPFGVWRLLPESIARVQPTELVPVIMPSLVAMLTAMEQKKGRPLEASEVSKLVADSPCVAMKRADALNLERSRGYADLEPDLAWEHWQLVRETL